MQGTVFISQICAVAVAFNSFFFLEMVKKNDSILKRQSFLTARVYSHGFQKRLIFSYEKVKT